MVFARVLLVCLSVLISTTRAEIDAQCSDMPSFTCPNGYVRMDLHEDNADFFQFTVINDRLDQNGAHALYPRGSEVYNRKGGVWMARIFKQKPPAMSIHCASAKIKKAAGINLVLRSYRHQPRGRMLLSAREKLPDKSGYTSVKFELPEGGVHDVEKIKLRPVPDSSWDVKNIHMIGCWKEPVPVKPCSAEQIQCPPGTERKDLTWDNRDFFELSLTNNDLGQNPADSLTGKSSEMLAMRKSVWMARIHQHDPPSMSVHCVSAKVSKASGMMLVMRRYLYQPRGRLLLTNRQPIKNSGYTQVRFHLPPGGVSDVEKIKLRPVPLSKWNMKNLHVVGCYKSEK